MKNSLRLPLLVAGLGLFGWFVQQTGWADIRGTFEALGWLGLLVLIPYAAVFSIDTLGWRFTFGPTALTHVSYLVTWRIRLIGEAINNVIPSMYVGGEAAKLFLLKREGVSRLTSASAAVRSKTAQSIAQSTFIAMGATMAALTLSSEHVAVKWAFAGIALIGFTVMALLFKIQKQGMVATLVNWVRSLGFKLQFASENEKKIQTLDDEIYHFYNRDKKQSRWCTLIYLLAWAFDTIEIMVVAHLLGAEVAWHHAFAMEAFIGVARGFNTVVPGALGVQDFSIVGLFVLFGYGSELGTQYAVARRGRDVVFAALGWLLLSVGEVTWQGIRADLENSSSPPQRNGAILDR